MKSGIELIAEKRQRQVSVEGWTHEHDNSEWHTAGQMADAAACYAKAAAVVTAGEDPVINQRTPSEWPWDFYWWKPGPDPVRMLAKAGALIAAEIDRLQRREAPALPHSRTPAL